MVDRIEIKDEDFTELIDKGHVTILIRLANIFQNWGSNLDKKIAKKIPELKEMDESFVDPKLGDSNRIIKTISNPFLIGIRKIDCYNCYCVDKDESGKFILDKNSLKNFLNELEKNKKGQIFTLLVKNEGLISKALVHKILQETIQFNKVWIAE